MNAQNSKKKTGTPRDFQSRSPPRRERKDSSLLAPRLHTGPHGWEHGRTRAPGRGARPVHGCVTFGGRDPTRVSEILVGHRPERHFCRRRVELRWGSHPLGKRLPRWVKLSSNCNKARAADKAIAVSIDTIRWFDSQLERAYRANAPQLEKIRRKNILALFQARGIKLLAAEAQ
jgi:hypothetical protein